MTEDEEIHRQIDAALKHPLRRRLLRFYKRPASEEQIASPRQASEELNEPLHNVSYHVRVLKKAGLLEPAGTLPVKGSLQHFYRLDPERSRLPKVARALHEGAG